MKGAIADLRYSAVPHKIQPIWGIRLDTKNPENHADYVSFTRPNGRALNVTWTMLLGEYQPHPRRTRALTNYLELPNRANYEDVNEAR